MKYAVIFEKSRTGYGAYIPDLPGCIAAGSTLTETRRLIRSAARMHLEAMREDSDAIPPSSSRVGYVSVYDKNHQRARTQPAKRAKVL